MTYEEAKKLREAFQKIHKAGFDDAKAPDFFSEIARKTVTPEQCKIALSNSAMEYLGVDVKKIT